MDLRRVLNNEQPSRSSTRSSQLSSRPGTSRQHSRSSTSTSSGIQMAQPLKLQSTWKGSFSPVTSPTESTYSSGLSWAPSMSPVENTPALDRYRVVTTIPSPSTTTKRRGPGHSPISQSSSSCSSPAPPTPSSISSAGHSFTSVSSGLTRQHKRGPSSDTGRPERRDALPGFHQIAMQTPYTINMTTTPAYAIAPEQHKPVHHHRVLPPLPASRPIQIPSPMVIRPSSQQHHHHQPVPKQPQQQLFHQQQQQPQPQAHHQHQSSARTCSAVPNCEYTIQKRRIVSQFFGRNKKETRLIPRHCWVYYCRKHYQRSRYRLKPPRFAELQMDLVRATVLALEKEGIVVSWDVKLRKRALEQIARSDGRAKKGAFKGVQGTGAVVREKLLLPYTGSGKSFKHVYDVLDVVKEICARDGGPALEFEILPNFEAEWVVGDEERRRAARAAGFDSDSESDEED